MSKKIAGLLGFLFVLFLFYADSATARSVRVVNSKPDQVIDVKTALGYSTIIEFPSKPISAVLGDQDAFKLEFVQNAITLKPLISRAKSNLFVFTEYERFNCTIMTSSPSDVDYIVKIQSRHQEDARDSSESRSSKPREVVHPVNLSAKHNGFTLKVSSVGHYDSDGESRGVSLINFQISSKNVPYTFTPTAIGVKQRSSFLTLESLYVDDLNLMPGDAPTTGKIALLDENFNRNIPFQVVFAVPATKSPKAKPYRLTISIDPKPSPRKQKPTQPQTKEN